MAHFIGELERLQAVTKEEQEEILSQMEQVLAEIAHIEYEKLSGEIHQLEEQMRFHLSNRDMVSMEKGSGGDHPSAPSAGLREAAAAC